MPWGSASRQACASKVFKSSARRGREVRGAGMASNGAGGEGGPFFCPISEECHSFAILLPPWSQRMLSKGQDHPSLGLQLNSFFSSQSLGE